MSGELHLPFGRTYSWVDEEKKVFNDRVLLAIHRALHDTLVQDREIQAMQ